MNHSHALLSLAGRVSALALPTTLPSVFDYEDYHAFLRDWVAARKARWPAYSLQLLANRAKIKSRSFLRLVCLGERRLGQDVAQDVASAMGMQPVDRMRFLELVAGERPSHGSVRPPISAPQRKMRVEAGLLSREGLASGATEIQFACTLPVALGMADLAELGERLRAYQADMEAWLAHKALISPPCPVLDSIGQ